MYKSISPIQTFRHVVPRGSREFARHSSIFGRGFSCPGFGTSGGSWSMVHDAIMLLSAERLSRLAAGAAAFGRSCSVQQWSRQPGRPAPTRGETRITLFHIPLCRPAPASCQTPCVCARRQTRFRGCRPPACRPGRDVIEEEGGEIDVRRAGVLRRPRMTE